MKARAVAAVKSLFRTLQRKYNKVYMRDLESLFARLENQDLTPREVQALEYLRIDLERDN